MSIRFIVPTQKVTSAHGSFPSGSLNTLLLAILSLSPLFTSTPFAVLDCFPRASHRNCQSQQQSFTSFEFSLQTNLNKALRGHENVPTSNTALNVRKNSLLARTRKLSITMNAISPTSRLAAFLCTFFIWNHAECRGQSHTQDLRCGSCFIILSSLYRNYMAQCTLFFFFFAAVSSCRPLIQPTLVPPFPVAATPAPGVPVSLLWHGASLCWQGFPVWCHQDRLPT